MREAVSLQQAAMPSITFAVVGADDPCHAFCDADQISQVLTNLLQNAGQALVERPLAETEGVVRVAMEPSESLLRLIIEDNGPGFPPEIRNRLAEPYVTTKRKGTGLGLAIVQNIVTDHDGWLRFADREEGGARVIAAIRIGSEDEGEAGGA